MFCQELHCNKFYPHRHTIENGDILLVDDIFPSGAKSETLNLGLDQIPLEALEEIGKRFVKGEARYGRDNWKSGDEEWLRERANHAVKHLYQYIQNTDSEDSPIDNLAAVGWFAVIAISLTKQKQKPSQA